MGRPPKFSRAQLQATALALVDEQGLAGLSMRSLAAVLGTGPMTLYNHVADRTDLEVLVVEAVGAEMHRPHSARDDWIWPEPSTPRWHALEREWSPGALPG